jgi:hypothetical protein
MWRYMPVINAHAGTSAGGATYTYIAYIDGKGQDAQPTLTVTGCTWLTAKPFLSRS